MNLPFIKPKAPPTEEELEQIRVKNFFDMICPGSAQFHPDYFTLGDTFRCVWAIRDYPPSTKEQALLSRLGNRAGVTLRLYHRDVSDQEEKVILTRSERRNSMKHNIGNLQESVNAAENLQDLVTMLADMHREREKLLHCAVFIELEAKSLTALDTLKRDVGTELTRSKIGVDMLTLRQRDGFLSVMPFGVNRFGIEFERAIPASAAANLFPYNYAGKTDPNGFYIGKDRYGTNIIVDLDRIDDDLTCPGVLILGNPGQGKSYLVKLLLCNLREAGKRVFCLDPESEYSELCRKLGGCCLDFMSGEYCINPLEPKAWTDKPLKPEEDAPIAFKKATRLSQHIAFLKDFFRAYKDFTDAQIDTIEILLSKLYARFGITDSTDYSTKKPTDFPIMEDFYKLCEEEFMTYDRQRKYIYTEELLQQICLSLHSMCVGPESCYFNGHTNVTADDFLVFGVQGLLETNDRLRRAMLFNILSWMSNELLARGNAVASVDELYLFLGNKTVVEYLRNMVKRARKRDSLLILASQHVEDFFLPAVKEYTKPLLTTPSHRFLFHPGNVNSEEFAAALGVEKAEYKLIRRENRGKCLYHCGSERYYLEVVAPEYKSALFGKAGGR